VELFFIKKSLTLFLLFLYNPNHILKTQEDGMSTKAFIDEFFEDVDETLDRLIENAETLEEIESLGAEYQSEIYALKNMQESLLSHLVNLDELMEHDNVKPHKNKELREKVAHYSEINAEILPTIGKRFKIEHNQLKIRKSRSTKTKAKAFVKV
jgi:hypothetical protein